MTTTRPPYQWELAFPTTGPGEAVGRRGQEVEMATAAPGPESPAATTNLIDGNRLIRRTAVVRTRMPGGVGGVAPRGVPLSRCVLGMPSSLGVKVPRTT